MSIQNPDESTNMRGKAASYAKSFLANKYYDEYRELYDAYLKNRGFTTRNRKVTTDERIITND